MSVEPENFSTSEWVDYNTYWTSVVVLAVLGGILIVVGFSWGIQALEPAIQETETGVTIVEGAGSMGALYGPTMAAIGLTILIIAQFPFKKARILKDQVERKTAGWEA